MAGDLDIVLEKALKRDQWIAGFGLALLFLFAWAYLLGGAGLGMSLTQMTLASFFPHLQPTLAMGANVVMAPGEWSVAYTFLMIAMWWVMMIAMMTPSAAPIILLQARVARRTEAKGKEGLALGKTGAFAGGYLLAWLAFSLSAVFLQWAFEATGAVSATSMGSQSAWLSAPILFAAGLYQLSPMKDVCLRHCRAPAEFLSRHWRPGQLGAIRLGLLHGAYCVGCCWASMILLFVGGVMNPIWIVALAAIVLLEKIGPRGPSFGKAGGVLLIAWGGATLLV